MRKKNQISITESHQIQWKRRPSEIRGYQRTLYATTDNRDYLRVDYSVKDKRVRLYVEIARESGSSYYSIISAGKVTSERAAASGRSTGVSERISQHSDDFASINIPEVLKLIGGNYGIGGKNRSGAINKVEKQKEETRKKYFKESDSYSSGSGHGYKEFSSIRWFDFLDIFIGAVLTVGFYWYFDFSIVTAGIVASFYGIIIGLVDMFFRERNPLFLKILLFITTGIFLYVYGYFY